MPQSEVDSHGFRSAVAFKTTLPLLGAKLLHRGHVDRDTYWEVLKRADVVVSTAQHEFFGVAMCVFCIV